MKHPTVIMLFLLSAIGQSGAAVAGQNNFDIDIKELHSAPAKQPHRPPKARVKKEKAGTVEVREGFSSYTVRPGDHLFIILMRHYGLSGNAAERLIPEVMRLNGIRNPQGLAVGQQLVIPLPRQQARPAKLARKNPQPADQAAAEQSAPQEQSAQSEPPAQQEQPTPPASQEQPATPQSTEQTTSVVSAAKPSETAPEPMAQPAPNTGEQQITLRAAPPCNLARNMAQEMGLLVPAKAVLHGVDSFTAEYAGVTVVVACGLTPEEAYTYRRLLTRPDMQLLVFARDESIKNVIEKMARHIGLSYQPTDPFATGELPLTYFFPATGPNSHDVRLTIVP